MGHNHAHSGHQGHSHAHPEMGDRRLGWAIAVNMLLTAAQIIGGIVSGSLSLIADALHNFSDAIALIIAYAARKIARRPADPNMTFGYGRAEVIAALVNYTSLIIIALYLGYEGLMRFFEPTTVIGPVMVIIAAIALVVDLITAALTYRMAKTSVNIRAAFLHNIADALGSVAVIVAGGLIWAFGWNWVDPLITVLISAYILWHSFVELPPVIRILMEGAPPNVPVHKIAEALEEIEGVQSVHHLHVWDLHENETALEAHVVIAEGSLAKHTAIKARLRACSAERFGVTHTTFEFETESALCEDQALIAEH